MVLKAKEVIAPQETPFKRIAVPNNSAGTAQLRGPLVRKNTVHDCKQAEFVSEAL
jgi:hypothetical protein